MAVFFEQGLVFLSALLIWYIQFLTFKYIDQMPASRSGRIVHIGLIPMLLSVVYIWGILSGFPMVSNVFFWCALMLNLYIACHIPLQSALMSSGIISFNMMIIRNIVISSIAIYYSEGTKEVYLHGNETKILFVCCLFSAVLFFIGALIDPNDTQKLKANRYFAGSKVVLLGIVLFNIYLLFCIVVAKQGVIVKETVVFYLFSILWLLFMGLVLLAYEGQNAKNRKQKNHLNRFNEQLKRQLQYYQSYKDYTESLRDFKYDYKKMMASVTALMSDDKMDEARQLILSINDEMNKKIEVHKQYSNCILMDALLQDVANRCKAQNITFEAKLYIPKTIKIDEKTFCHILIILCEEGMKSANTDRVEERKLTIKSAVKGNWLTIKMTCPKSKELFFDLLYDEIQKNEGILKREIDEEGKCWRVSIHLPISENDHLKE